MITKKLTNNIVSKLDHQFLNDLKPFKKMNPTAENIAKYLYCELSKILVKKDIVIKSIKLWENDRSAVTYSE